MEASKQEKAPKNKDSKYLATVVALCGVLGLAATGFSISNRDGGEPQPITRTNTELGLQSSEDEFAQSLGQVAGYCINFEAQRSIPGNAHLPSC